MRTKELSSSTFVTVLAVAIAFVLSASLPLSALAGWVEYSGDGVILTLQAVDANGDPLNPDTYDYSKFTAAGIGVGTAVSASTIIDDTTVPDVNDPPDSTLAAYQGAYPIFTIHGTTPFSVDLMTVNNGVAVLDERPPNTDDIPFIHDVFGFGGSVPTNTTGPSWLQLNSGTEAVRKGTAVIAVSIISPGALSSTALPAPGGLNLASFNLAVGNRILMDLIDTDTGQLVTLTSSLTSLEASASNGPNLPPAVPGLGAVAAALLGAGMLGSGGWLANRSKVRA